MGKSPACLLLMLFLSSILPSAANEGERVSISISIHPLSSVDFPAGQNFLIRVPRNASPRGATIQPVRIPFTVTTNAVAYVSARAVNFVQVMDEADTRFLGEALGPNGDSDELGYDIVIQFPVPSANYSGLPGRGGFSRDLAGREGVATLPGTGVVETPALFADSADTGQQIHGVLHIVSRQHWTPNGELAAPGDYRGSVEITVGAKANFN